jgi:hypothetical protein
VITQPMPTAVGDEVSRRIAAAMATAGTPDRVPVTARAPTSKTIPLAAQGPIIPMPAPSTPRGGMHAAPVSTPISPPASPPMGSTGPQSPMAFPSGVVHVQTPTHAHPPVSMTTPNHPIAPMVTGPIVASRAPQKSTAWIVAVIAIVLVAVGGGAMLALMHR